ncbi:MAG: diphosphate--fructose-6-phosphate 1-phosphotransferase [Peptoclostridium sp.]|uniref:6-phosphofructokinase n=1 Tax=Peptoclostridium sp. TaxID=1904860 RepID=UPI00139BFC7C|nr:6-phosphofructokinase [Peptoclostridium sp.]MZQ75472.1 diphosphate--fructose-6-phosphate 1-phosphotransferase [Peptoclostridium sp.]
MSLNGNVVVAQGGGPTAVINESLVGVVLESRKFAQVNRVYGALGGVRGIVNEDFLDLTQETTHNLEEVAKTPSSALLSTRDKPDEKYCREIFEVFKAHNVRYFFYIGGNDSVGTVDIVNRHAKTSGYDFRAIHIPKTIDNDIVLTDHTPGFGSAAKFVAQSFIGLNLDNRALPGIHIGVVMGRNSGFLTASSVLAKKYPDDGPHLIYMPERNFCIDGFIRDVRQAYERYGRCLVAVSEGIADENGVPIAQKLGSTERDAHGNLLLSQADLGELLVGHIKRTIKTERVRSDTFGYLQRSFGLCISEVDQYEAREAGEKAAQFSIWHDRDGSISLSRIGDYAIDYKLQRLEDVANRTKVMSDNFISGTGNHVTEEFKNYIRPLVGSGLRDGQRLIAPPVEKLLRL